MRYFKEEAFEKNMKHAGYPDRLGPSGIQSLTVIVLHLLMA